MVKATVQPKIQHILSLLHICLSLSRLLMCQSVMEASAEECLLSLRCKIVWFIFAPDAEIYHYLFLEVTIQFLKSDQWPLAIFTALTLSGQFWHRALQKHVQCHSKKPLSHSFSSLECALITYVQFMRIICVYLHDILSLGSCDIVDNLEKEL